MSDIVEEYRQKKLAKLCQKAIALCAESSFAAPTLFGVIVQAGTDTESGMPRLTIETTEQQLRDLSISPYGKQCRVEVYQIEATDRACCKCGALGFRLTNGMCDGCSSSHTPNAAMSGTKGKL